MSGFTLFWTLFWDTVLPWLGLWGPCFCQNMCQNCVRTWPEMTLRQTCLYIQKLACFLWPFRVETGLNLIRHCFVLNWPFCRKQTTVLTRNKPLFWPVYRSHTGMLSHWLALFWHCFGHDLTLKSTVLNSFDRIASLHTGMLPTLETGMS